MLSLMRKHSGSWIIKILLGSIVAVFILWGVGSMRERRASQIANVNGESISFDKYRETYTNMIERFAKNSNTKLTEDIKTIFKRQALEQLINQKVLIQEAKKNNIKVSNEELSSAISKIEIFQEDGKFVNLRYQRILAQLHLSPEEFESMQQESMMIEKLGSLITSNVKVSKQEAKEWFDWNKESVNIEYVHFDPNSYKVNNISDKDIETYFGLNKIEYQTEPQIKVRYLYFDPKSYQSKFNITQENIKDYYESNKKSFISPKTVEARHILIKVEADTEQKIAEEARKKALDILKMAKAGEDFKALAKKYSESPDKDNDGYLGTFRKEEMVQPFSDKAFSMKAGEISEPVRTQFGWHIIKVEKVNEEIVPSLKDVENNIKQKLIDTKTKKAAYEEAESVSDICFDGEDISKIAKGKNLKIYTSDYFNKNGPNTIKDSAKFATASFNMEALGISDVQDLTDGYYIIQVIEKIPAKIPDYKIVKDKVKINFEKKKQEELASKAADEFLENLKKGLLMADVCKKSGMSTFTSGFFKRDGSIPNLENEQLIIQTALNLSKSNPLPDHPIKGTKGYYVIKFLEKKLPDASEFEKESAQITKSLLEQKKMKTFESWQSQLKKKSKIETEENFL